MPRPDAASRPLRLVTWNINSVRARLALIDRFLDTYAPDILCLQETKVADDQFPRRWFAERGWRHMAIHGQRSYHGVATLARVPFNGARSIDWCARGDARHVQVSLKMFGGKVVLHNFYVPAGGDEPDPQVNDKFAHKLTFLDEMIDWSRGLDTPSILVGDLNVAPLATDVWNHKALLGVVSHTPPETERLAALADAHGWIDVMRHFVPPEEALYSWWSYRARDWRASNRGRRLDHVWISPALAPAMRSMAVLDAVRGWDKPSDHAPVLVELDLG